jgi:uncharacterized protein YjbI with pentapeptide repeats
MGWRVPDVLARRHTDPSVESAYIGAIATFLGVGATAAVAIFAFWYARSTNQATLKAANANLEEQGKQLNLTLAEERIRTLNERFATAVGQLDSDKSAAVRLAGAYAMAGLADDWPENRQTCVDVLCAYMRLPHDPDPGDDADPAGRTAYRANREVRHTIIRVITAHLRDGAVVSWQGLNFDFTGVVFDGGDFSGAQFSRGVVLFNGAVFSGGEISFRYAGFSGGHVSFSRAVFSGGTVIFDDAQFSGGTVNFSGAGFSGSTVNFRTARFSGSTVHFNSAVFSGGTVDFSASGWVGGARFSGGAVHFSRAGFSGSTVSFRDAQFSGGTVHFSHAGFSGGTVDFSHAGFSGGTVHFIDAQFSGGTVIFDGAQFSGGTVHFLDAQFSGGTVDFSHATFSGGTVHFLDAQFSGGQVDFSNIRDWSVPPEFPWTDTPPPGVKLPNEDQSQG